VYRIAMRIPIDITETPYGICAGAS
jgi:hypothetical protein